MLGVMASAWELHVRARQPEVRGLGIVVQCVEDCNAIGVTRKANGFAGAQRSTSDHQHVTASQPSKLVQVGDDACRGLVVANVVLRPHHLPHEGVVHCVPRAVVANLCLNAPQLVSGGQPRHWDSTCSSCGSSSRCIASTYLV